MPADQEGANAVSAPGAQNGDGTSNQPRHEEYQYLDLIKRILKEGERRPDRTGTGTISLFAPPQLRFSLSRPSSASASGYEPVLPLLTTKRVPLKAMLHELLWFISGCTHTKPLSAAGVKIWDGNGSREFLDRVGLKDYSEGELGPVYGFQWRHFGAKYRGPSNGYGYTEGVDYADDEGVDQLKEVIRKLKENPYDRRIIMSAWNVADLGKMALPPCHMFAQFYVSYPDAERGAAPPSSGDAPPAAPNGSSSKAKGRLSCQLYQRSCDMGLGVPFNIASYAALTHILAHTADLEPGEFVHVLGDTHVYADHVEALSEQLKREPRAFPTVKITRGDRGSGTIDGWKIEEFAVEGYEPHAAIKMKMSV